MNIKKVVVDWILNVFGYTYIWVEQYKDYPDDNNILGKSFPAFTAQNKFEGVTIGSIIAGALGITFLMSTLNKRGRY